MVIADSQASLWHRGNNRYRCFLPDLTGFTGPPRTGPGYQQSTSAPLTIGQISTIISLGSSGSKPRATNLLSRLWGVVFRETPNIYPCTHIQGALSLNSEATFRSIYRFDKLTALRLSKGRLSTGGPSSSRGLDRCYGVKNQ